MLADIAAVGMRLAVFVAAILVGASAAQAQTVATYHGAADRSGHYVMPALSWDRAANLRPEPGFTARFHGNLYAQPLYWHRPGRQSGMFVVASESNTVTALDATSGATLWSTRVGIPVKLSAFPCGNIDPLGITGTPIIDEASGTLYLDAMVADAPGPRHKLFALSLADGSVRPDWPIDVGDALQELGQTFDSRVQNQRGALLLRNGTLYVPYGGFFGDCGDYRGWVVGVDVRDPRRVSMWRTSGRGGGIWAPGGIAGDETSLYVTTGNTEGATTWSDGEAVIRLAPDLHHSTAKADYFAPSDWRALDDRDADLGGSNPLPLDVPGANGPQKLLLALGKDEHAYLLDRTNLGGVGGALLAEHLASYAIRTAPAAYTIKDATYVAFQGRAAKCPEGQSGDLMVLRIGGSPPSMQTAWCGAMKGGGGPIVTTTDAEANPIVWIVGAEGDERLHGFRGDTGQKLFTSPPLTGLRHFQTLIAADNRLIVGADGRLYAFSLAP